MKKLVVLCLLLAAASRAWARGGGGCFEEGTPILTPRGEVPIERLCVGDEVIGGCVEAIARVEPDEFLELAGGVHVTPEHPFEVAPGVFRAAERVFPEVHRIPAVRPAYNLLVSPGGRYFAERYIVHNKGCFLPDTQILRADGSRIAIGEVRPGEKLLAFDADGNIVTGTIRDILTHEVDEYLVVRTDRVELRVTVEHPFYVGDGTFKTLEALSVGDSVYAYDGHGLSAQRIVSIEHVRARTRVYNMQTDRPNTFFANGIAVHNKGGGCFPAGTPIRTPQGEVAIEKVRPGDIVLNGQGGTAVVEATFVTRAPVLVVETDAGTLRTTTEHPLLCANGEFRLAGELSRGNRLSGATVMCCVPGCEELVYNLRVGAPHTFVASGFVVHNKGGGCFPAGTRVRLPRGEAAIETLRLGDVVLAGDGRKTVVEGVHATRDRVLTLVTSRGVLRTTAEHPLLCADGQFRLAGELSRGDRLPGATIVGCVIGDEETVYNLRVGPPHTFIADGFVVHNKGGGFGGGGFHGGIGYHGGSSGSGRPMTENEKRVLVIVAGSIIVIIIIYQAAAARKGTDENLDFCYSRTAIEPKAAKTRKLLEFIARTDATFAEEKLQQIATATFVKLQECWQSREYAEMEPRMMPDLYRQHCTQIASLRRNHEINIIESLRVIKTDIVNVRYTHKPEQREFTALISASARDYYVDDRTQLFLRGDEESAMFQEFWTFQFHDGAWLLREIEQTRESDALKDENFFEQFTDAAVDKVYGDAAKGEGVSGPWLEKGVETKATRIERLLNFLVQTDKLWDRQTMLERAREVFMRVQLTLEARDATALSSDDLFSETKKGLETWIAECTADGRAVEYRNLCVRKVELVLVRNFSDNTQDEFVTRISAHAQRIVTQNGAVLHGDEYVSPWEEYWTFGRLDDKWKLKEVLPPGSGERLIKSENIDEDSSKPQLQWYYQHKRAT